MKTQIIIIAMLSIATLCGCVEDDLCLTGSGTVHTYEIETTDFDEISIFGPVNLRYTQGNAQSVTVVAEPEMFHYLDYHVNHHTLYIGYEENIRCFKTAHEVWINVTHPELGTIEADGDHRIFSDGPIVQPSIYIDATGEVQVQLTGQVQQQFLSASGSLKARNFGLQSQHTYVDVSGSSELEVTCNETLDIDVSGASSVYYKGHPVINKDVAGSLSLQDAN